MSQIKMYLPAAMTAAGAAMLAVSSPVEAAAITELMFDVNSVTIQATNTGGANGAFGGLTHTGGLVFGKDSDSTMSLFRDHAPASPYNGTFTGFAGMLQFNNGVLLGGSMTLTVLNPDSSTDQYTFLVNGSPNVHISQPLGTSAFRSFGFQLDANTSDGHFTDSNFGGADITVFKNGEPLAGAFFQLVCKPDASGFSAAADVDIYVRTEIVPVPAAATGGLALLGLLGAYQWVKSRSAGV